ncbi:MAG: lasso peptide biosynthesis B2 protein [Peptococcaceae bacterium]|nr:lasso peptide biosynthesis B2 protein [Peptococcaceae bacterium]
MKGSGKIRKLYSLGKRTLLCGGVFLLLGAVRLTLLVVPFKHIAARLGEKMGESPDAESWPAGRKAARIGWAVGKMSRYTPWESKCLVQAVTAHLLLRLFGLSYTLYLGLGLEKDEDGKLSAHAWLRCGDLIITGGREKEGFRSVAQFAGAGRR